MGRPSEFTQECADQICEHLADGRSLRDICMDADMPARSTVFKWLGQNQTFADQYARAREAQADLMADEILEIADDSTHDTKYTDSGEQPNAEWISRSRLRVDARKWLASKMAPKKYGDRIEQNHSGEIGLTVHVHRGSKSPE